jgi:hypothetical protein
MGIAGEGSYMKTLGAIILRVEIVCGGVVVLSELVLV